MRGQLLAWSFLGAAVVMAIGLILNRLLDLSVYFFYPGSAIVNRLGLFDSYTTPVKLGITLVNLLIWVGIIYVLLTLGRRDWLGKSETLSDSRSE